MKKRMYWLWLTLKESLKPLTVCELVAIYGSPEAVYNETEYKNAAWLSDASKAELCDKSMANAEKVVERMNRLGGYILTIDDEEYPPLLKNIFSPPCVLYVMGEHLDWSRLLTISIVGTRKYTAYGKRAAQTIARSLANKGATVVSGMARGIDSIAGEAAIATGAKSIAVLGSGVDVVYPGELISLYNAIRCNGAVISEFPPGTKPLPQNFPRRNRIMAGLSYGTLVVQAPIRSGALITAAHAIDNNRDVFAVPGDIFDINQAGTNALLNAGAKAVTCADDIIEEYKYLDFRPLHAVTYDIPNIEAAPTKPSSPVKKEIDLSGLDETERKIVCRLNGSSLHADELARELEISSAEIGSTLIMLEINGVIKQTADNKYELN